MVQNTMEHKKQYKVNSRPLWNLLIGLGFFSIILLITMISASKDTGIQSSQGLLKPQGNNQAAPAEDTPDGQMLAVVKAIDTDNKKISLYDVNQQKTLELNYNGGTNIADKYDKLMAISQIEVGSMVDASYQADKNKLTDMNISSKAWEYAGVNNFTIDLNAKIMKIAATKYKFGDDVQVMNGQEFVPISTITKQDELTVRGYEETIYSITVTRGHGTVALEDYDAFLGANITIGYEAMQQITKGMEITVREGEFDLTVDTGNYTASKKITVKRNKVTYVSLSDLNNGALQQSKVSFDITPFGADLYIDGDLTSYANPIILGYGDHNIKVSMGGYTTYEGKLKVDSAGKTIKIDLPESSSTDSVSVTETDNTTDTGTGSTGTGTNSTDTSSGSTDTGTDNTDTGTDSTSSGDTQDSSGDTVLDSSDNIDKEHMIYVQKPAGASVYIDGEFKCIAPGSFLKVLGTHVITFIKDGYTTQSYTIEVSDDGLDTTFTFPDLSKKSN
ncbi:MAG TPA: PEGA domain-containing protein [Mobilitalea sp.]|nr:PEGA domain-containing protein [Mobilitalea sp.]